MDKKVLQKALADVSPAALETAARKSERLNLRCTPAEKQSLDASAAALGLGVSEYLLALHEYAAARLSVKAARTGKRG